MARLTEAEIPVTLEACRENRSAISFNVKWAVRIVVGIITLILIGSIGWAIVTERQIGSSREVNAAQEVQLENLSLVATIRDATFGHSLESINTKLDEITRKVDSINTKQQVMLSRIDSYHKGD